MATMIWFNKQQWMPLLLFMFVGTIGLFVDRNVDHSSYIPSGLDEYGRVLSNGRLLVSDNVNNHKREQWQHNDQQNRNNRKKNGYNSHNNREKTYNSNGNNNHNIRNRNHIKRNNNHNNKRNPQHNSKHNNDQVEKRETILPPDESSKSSKDVDDGLDGSAHSMYYTVKHFYQERNVLPEGIDFSAGGWATEYAVALLAALLFATSVTSQYYIHPNRKQTVSHCQWMYLGTTISQFYGGMAHRLFPNISPDGSGRVPFYIIMIVSYGGNCMRYGKGWGLDKDINIRSTTTSTTQAGNLFFQLLPYVAVVNFTYMFVVGWLNGMVAYVNNDDKSNPTPLQILFVCGEFFIAFMEILTSIWFFYRNKTNSYAIVATVFNGVAWTSLYGAYFYSAFFSHGYSPNGIARLFNGCMIVMLWALNSMVVESVVLKKPTWDDDQPAAKNNEQEEEKVGIASYSALPNKEDDSEKKEKHPTTSDDDAIVLSPTTDNKNISSADSRGGLLDDTISDMI